MSGETIDMQAVCDELMRREIPAYVEQTGGGCATIYVGVPREDGRGDKRFQACAGPGWFEGPGWTRPFGDLADFYVGPDDDGEADPVRARPGWGPQKVADLLQDVARLGPHACHLENKAFDPRCGECSTDAEAVEWLRVVRSLGLDEANRRFPEEEGDGDGG